jgi:ferritin
LATSAEIEELIVRLHKDGKNLREISKVVHKNFTYIGAVLRRRFPEEYVNNNSTTSSIETQAVDLFAKGKGPIYAVRKLNMKLEETKKLYSNYLDATNHHTLTQVYKEVEETLPIFLKLFFQMREANIDVENVAKVVELIDKIPHIENQYKEVSDNIRKTLEQEYCVMNEISRLKREKTALQNYNTSLSFESVSKQQELQNLNCEVGNLRTFIQEINNGEDYQKIRRTVEEHVKRVMNDRMMIIE